MDDWLPRCADLMDVMRKKWIDLVPINNLKYGGRSMILFRCIHALMSHQLTTLITRTVDHLLAIFQLYQNGNQLPMEYAIHNPKLQRKPLITLLVTIVGVYFDHAPINNFPMNNDVRDELYNTNRQDNITPFNDEASSCRHLENQVNIGGENL